MCGKINLMSCDLHLKNEMEWMERNGIKWNGMELRKKRKNKIKSVCSVDSKGNFVP